MWISRARPPDSATCPTPFTVSTLRCTCVVAISVILTPMFNAARGSLLVAALFHAQMNGPAWPDAQPWDMLGFVLVAVQAADDRGIADHICRAALTGIEQR